MRIFALFLFVFLIFVSCSDNKLECPEFPDEITVSEGDTIEENYTEFGWKNFKTGSYSIAIDYFSLALEENSDYSDAYCGLGWCYLKLDSMEIAEYHFTLGILAATHEEELLTAIDSYAGRSYVCLRKEDYVNSIKDANCAIYSEYCDCDSRPAYSFRFDMSLTENDLLLVIAESHFMLRDYTSCFDNILLIDIFDSSAYEGIDLTNDPGKLADIIENLKSRV